MRKVSVPGPHFPSASGGGSYYSVVDKPSLKKQSSFDLSTRKISCIAPPPGIHREHRISVIVTGTDPSRRLSTASNRGYVLQRHSSSFDASEFQRSYLESHFNETEITTVTSGSNSNHLNSRSVPPGVSGSKKPLFQPSLEASSKFKKKLRTKTEEEQTKLLEMLHKISFETHELRMRTDECLQGGKERSNMIDVTSRDHQETGEEEEESNSLIRNFCLTTFKILTLVNKCYEIVKSIQTHGASSSLSPSSSTSSSSSSFLSQGTLLSESFRNHDFGKDISVSYFGLDWNELRSLIRQLETQVSLIYNSSRKTSVEHYSHYYGHHYRKQSSNGLSEISENGSSGTTTPSLESLCVSMCKNLRKVRDDVLSHTEAVLRGRLSPVNKQIISEEQNRFRAYTVINSLLSHSHSPLERKGSFTNKLMSLFHPISSQKKKQQVDNVWSEWFEVACNQTQLLQRIQEI